jgi:hypothetical protein
MAADVIGLSHPSVCTVAEGSASDEAHRRASSSERGN